MPEQVREMVRPVAERQPSDRGQSLTAQQKVVLRLLAEGDTDDLVARKLGCVSADHPQDHLGADGQAAAQPVPGRGVRRAARVAEDLGVGVGPHGIVDRGV